MSDASGQRAGGLLLAVGIFLGLAVLGYQLATAAIRFKEYERTVVVKGLSEREVAADVVLWPITFTEANNDLSELYLALERSTRRVHEFLQAHQIPDSAVSVAQPAITDKSAQAFGGGPAPEFRYSALQTVTVYSTDVEVVRAAMRELAELGKAGIAFVGANYDNRVDYAFTGLNDLKPAMIEEATRNARAVAEKFAQDSQSRLGKIRQASQGQFSVEERDRNNPHIKRVRVVSTIEYYLSD